MGGGVGTKESDAARGRGVEVFARDLGGEGADEVESESAGGAFARWGRGVWGRGILPRIEGRARGFDG